MVPPIEEAVYWTQLLQLMRAGLVVPVLGSELLQIGDELLYERLARDLAKELGLSEEPKTLNEVAVRYLQERRAANLSVVYVILRKLIETGDYPVPEPLRKLAAITPLTLFLTTTFDTSMEKAIDETRHGGVAKTKSVSHSLNYEGDLPAELKDTRGPFVPPIVFHLFGLPFPWNEYAVTDEDVLEYIHSLQSGRHRPETLFQYVADKHLLIIGSSFTDWLARFFIRSAKRERIWMARGREDFVVDTALQRDPSFALFLQHFGAGMKVFSMPPVAFVDELHRRWMAEQASMPAPAPVVESSSSSPLRKMAPGSIFLSYASEDREAASTIAKQLGEANLDVWIDHAKLRVGQDYGDVIQRNIADASIFIALVSKSSLQARSFFRREWADAINAAKERISSPPYLLVYSIDGTRIEQHSDRFPARFLELHYEFADDGKLSKRQVEDLVRWFVEHETLREVPR